MSDIEARTIKTDVFCTNKSISEFLLNINFSKKCEINFEKNDIKHKTKYESIHFILEMIIGYSFK